MRSDENLLGSIVEKLLLLLLLFISSCDSNRVSQVVEIRKKNVKRWFASFFFVSESLFNITNRDGNNKKSFFPHLTYSIPGSCCFSFNIRSRLLRRGTACLCRCRRPARPLCDARPVAASSCASRSTGPGWRRPPAARSSRRRGGRPDRRRRSRFLTLKMATSSTTCSQSIGNWYLDLHMLTNCMAKHSVIRENVAELD